MIDFGKISEPINITAEYILARVDEVQIFYYYWGHFEIGKVYPSKLRRDSKPSTGFFIHRRTKNILYSDLSTGEKLNCFQYVQKLYNCSYPDAINRIAQDFGLIHNVESQPLAKKILSEALDFDREIKAQKIIQFIPDIWQGHHLNYWGEYEITRDELDREQVYPVKSLFINKLKYNVEKLCFAYLVTEKTKQGDKTYTKIYSPHSEFYKWISNVPITVPFGISSLNYGSEHILVGKAQKDRIVLLKLFKSVLGTQNESESALPEQLVKHLCHNFGRRTIIWDSDDAGVNNCKKFNDKGFGYFNTPRDLIQKGIKDVSDYVKVFGMKALEQLLKEKQIL